MVVGHCVSIEPNGGQIKKAQSEGWGFLWRAHGKDSESQASPEKKHRFGFQAFSRLSFSRIGSTWCLNARLGLFWRILVLGLSPDPNHITPLQLWRQQSSSIPERVSGAGPILRFSMVARWIPAQVRNSTHMPKQCVSVLINTLVAAEMAREVSYQGSLPASSLPVPIPWPRCPCLWLFQISTTSSPSPTGKPGLTQGKPLWHLEFTPQLSPSAVVHSVGSLCWRHLHGTGILSSTFRTLTALSTHPAHTRLMKLPCIAYTYFNPRLKILTMCLAAKTPSTMAQQKAVITPKLIKTIEATSCWGTKQKCLLAFHSHCFRGCGDPQETSRQSRMLAHHPTGRPFSVAWGKGMQRRGPWSMSPHVQGKLRNSLRESVSTQGRGGYAWLFHSETQKSVRPLISRSPTPILFTVELEAREGKWCSRSLARPWKSLCPSTPSTVTCPTPHDSEAPHNLTWPCITEEGRPHNLWLRCQRHFTRAEVSEIDQFCAVNKKIQVRNCWN